MISVSAAFIKILATSVPSFSKTISLVSDAPLATLIPSVSEPEICKVANLADWPATSVDADTVVVDTRPAAVTEEVAATVELKVAAPSACSVDEPDIGPVEYIPTEVTELVTATVELKVAAPSA